MTEANTRLRKGLFVAVLGLGCAGPWTPAAADLFRKDTKPAEEQPATAPKTAGMKEAMGGVVDLAAEVKLIDKRLESIDQSVKAISNSLAPVGTLARPEAMNALVREAEELAYERGRSLIFLATGCAAGLLVLLAVLWRWSNRPRKS